MTHFTYDLLNGEAEGDLLLLAEHAGNLFPEGFDKLGVAEALFEEHRNLAFDVGTAGIVHKMAEKLGSTAVLGRFSRLWVDLNRLENSVEIIPPDAHHQIIPGNQDLSKSVFDERIRGYYKPYHEEVERQVQRRTDHGAPTLFSIHSFTPSHAMALADQDGTREAPDIGLLYVEETPLLTALRAVLAEHSDIKPADNFPYDFRKVPLGSLHKHGVNKGFPSLAVEVSIDSLHGDADEARWAAIFCEACQRAGF